MNFFIPLIESFFYFKNWRIKIFTRISNKFLIWNEKFCNFWVSPRISNKLRSSNEKIFTLISNKFRTRNEKFCNSIVLKVKILRRRSSRTGFRTGTEQNRFQTMCCWCSYDRDDDGGWGSYIGGGGGGHGCSGLWNFLEIFRREGVKQSRLGLSREGTSFLLFYFYYFL